MNSSTDSATALSSYVDLSPLKVFILNFLDLLVLCSLSIAQPIFDISGKNSGIFAARDSDATEIIIFSVAVTFLAPVLLGLLEFIASLIGEKTRDYLHRVFVWLLIGLLLLSPLKSLFYIVGRRWILITLIFSGILSESYLRLRSRGLALAYLSPVALILPAIFMLHTPVGKIVKPVPQTKIEYPQIKATAPVVMVVFDELSLTSLMDDSGQINSSLYPNFAGLTRSSTWYRNASSISELTLHSIPSILDGLITDPNEQLLPNAKDHPHTLITLLGGSYRMHVVENNTRLCPEDLPNTAAESSSRYQRLRSLFSDIGILYLYILLPSDLTHSLPNITLSWKEFAAESSEADAPEETAQAYNEMTSFKKRAQVFAGFVAAIRPDPKPAFYFLHSSLPHAPWEYLPSGKKYTFFEKQIRGLVGVNDRGIDPQIWTSDVHAIHDAWKRHLLQVGFVDRLAGDLIDHLKETGLFEPCLLIITADHGVSFRTKASRREASLSNYADIMAIPLFIKTPYQKEGGINDSNVESIDILPTVADILRIQLPWPTDGRSALSSAVPERGKKITILENGQRLEFDPQLAGKFDTIKEKVALFGHDIEDLFRAGPYPELIGQIPDRAQVGKSSVRCDLDGRTYLENVDPEAGFVLTNICGRLTRDIGPAFTPLDLAVAINGPIRGTTQSFLDADGAERFSAVVSDAHFRRGYNQVIVYAVSNSGRRLELAEIESPEIPRYQWGEVLKFGSNGNVGPSKAEGWSAAEENFTWTNESRATIVLSVSPPQKPIRLRVFASAYVKPDLLKKQRVSVLVNRQPAVDWVFENRDFGVWEATIPQNFFNDQKRTVVTFELPDSIAPSTIGDGEDRRQLGLAVVWLQLSEE
jgi:hypothetical protein